MPPLLGDTILHCLLKGEADGPEPLSLQAEATFAHGPVSPPAPGGERTQGEGWQHPLSRGASPASEGESPGQTASFCQCKPKPDYSGAYLPCVSATASFPRRDCSSASAARASQLLGIPVSLESRQNVTGTAIGFLLPNELSCSSVLVNALEVTAGCV